MTWTWSRPLFEAACKEFVRHRHEWVWVEHAVSPGFGYMHRTTPIHRRGPPRVPPQPADDPAAAPPSPDHLTCHQDVVFSATFHVPTLYFSVHDSSGAPLALSQIMQTSLLRQDACDGMQVTAFSIGHPSSNFPLLSFGDHPTLRSQCWYLHPCETGRAVEEILAASLHANSQDPTRPVRWLDAWFLVLSSVVDLGG